MHNASLARIHYRYYCMRTVSPRFQNLPAPAVTLSTNNYCYCCIRALLLHHQSFLSNRTKQSTHDWTEQLVQSRFARRFRRLVLTRTTSYYGGCVSFCVRLKKKNKRCLIDFQLKNKRAALPACFHALSGRAWSHASGMNY